MSDFEGKVLKFKRSLVRELLDQCSSVQVKFFNKMYGGIDVIDENSMSHAYRQCQRTIEKNKKESETKS
jgi:hypothetical protein